MSQPHLASKSTGINEKKRLRSSSDSSSVMYSPEEELDLKTILRRMANLEETQLANTRRIAELEQENSALKRELVEMKVSLEFTQKEQDELKERTTQVEDDESKNKERPVKQELYNRRWNMLVHGMREDPRENCKEKLINLPTDKMGVRDARQIKFCGIHRLGRRTFGGRNRPIICRFTCREDKERIFRAKAKLKNTGIIISDDAPEEVREIRKRVLVPTLKKIRRVDPNMKTKIVGDQILIEGQMFHHDKIPDRWLSTADQDK